MINKPVLAVTVAALLLVQVGCVALYWPTIKSGNIDFAALLGTSEIIRGGSKPNYSQLSEEMKSPTGNLSTLRSSNGAAVDTLHPPIEAVIFLPLTKFEYLTAFKLWFLCNLTMFWVLIPSVVHKFLPLLREHPAILSVFCGTAFPVLICLMLGQDAIVLLLLFSITCSSLLGKKEWIAGLTLALGLFKFHLVLPIVLALIALRRWRAVAGFALAAFSLVTASIAFLGTGALLGYSKYVFEVGRNLSTSPSHKTPYMPNIRGLIAELAGPFNHPHLQTIAVVVLSAALLLAMVVWMLHFRTVPLAVSLSLAFSIASLVSYHYFIHNAVILLLPCLLMANEVTNSEFDVRLRNAVIASALLGYLMPLISFTGIISLEAGTAGLTVATIGIVTSIFLIPFVMKHKNSTA